MVPFVGWDEIPSSICENKRGKIAALPDYTISLDCYSLATAERIMERTRIADKI